MRSFTRIWCAYEIYVSLTAAAGRLQYDVYTAVEHEYKGDMVTEQRQAVGLCAAPIKAAGDWSGRLENADAKVAREKHFPLEIMLRAFAVLLEAAQASEPADKRRILAAIAGMEAEINDMLRGRFAAVALRARARVCGRMDGWAALEATRAARHHPLPSQPIHSTATHTRTRAVLCGAAAGAVAPPSFLCVVAA